MGCFKAANFSRHKHSIGLIGSLATWLCCAQPITDCMTLPLLQDVLNEVERNLHDAMGVARNVAIDPRLVPGGGAVEMAVSRGLNDKAAAVRVLKSCLSHGLKAAIVISACQHVAAAAEAAQRS